MNWAMFWLTAVEVFFSYVIANYIITHKLSVSVIATMIVVLVALTDIISIKIDRRKRNNVDKND